MVQRVNEAKEVLLSNYQPGGFTIPSKGLYPFQWKWDAGFIAIGLAHFDIEKAKTEISTLLKAQWKNGMIPHIVFHTDTDTYFPGKDFHQSNLSKQANPDYPSTGMVQPPVLGFVLEKLLEIATDKNDMLAFIGEQLDKVYYNHEYFYTHRDVNQEGLAYIYHNWESGTDNSPMWDAIWETMDPPHYKFERRDTTHVDPEQRPTNREYDHYLHLIEIAKKYHYEDAKIAAHSPFLVLDPLFNALLIKSNESLLALYQKLGIDNQKTKNLRQWQEKAINAFNKKLWSPTHGAYVHYDLRNQKQLPYISSSSFAPLFAPIVPPEKLVALNQTFQEKFSAANLYCCASFDPTHNGFNPKRYWRGPVWINMNWIIYHGFKRAGAIQTANRIKEDSITLIEKFGFKEYFDPRKKLENTTEGGYGGDNFSWSAALYLDLIKA